MGDIIEFTPPSPKPRRPDGLSDAMADWLRSGNHNDRLANHDALGRRRDPRIMRACEWRGWARRINLSLTEWGHPLWDNDDGVAWFITKEGHAAIRTLTGCTHAGR